MNELIVTIQEGKVVSVYAIADKEAGVEVRLEKGVDYEVCEY